MKKDSLGTVVICVAVDDEYRAVREHVEGPLDEHEERGCLYQAGQFSTARGAWRVVLTQTGAGNTQAGVQLERAITLFEPQIVLFVGVAGGVKDVRLGDVAVSDHVYGYEEGKDTAAGFKTRAKSFPGSHQLVQRAKKIARDDEWQHRIKNPPSEPLPHAVLKPTAAGEKVVADRESGTAQFLREHFSDAVAVEMEGHGFLYSAYASNLPGLVIRGISDLLSDKSAAADEKWQPIASHHAAAFAFELLSQLPPVDRALVQDVATVRAVTEDNLLDLDDHATLPGVAGRFAVDRAEFSVLIETEGSFVLTGEPGCGKSGALNRLARELLDLGEDVVLLTVDTLGSQPGSIRDGVQLSRSLSAVLQDWSGERRATLLVDGLDSSRNGPLTWLVNLIKELGGSRWRVIATMRRFDLRHSREWSRAFKGAPVSAEHVDFDLRRVRHFLLGNFSREELAKLADESVEVAQIIAGTGEHLIDLVCNPFNLRLACELLESGVSQASLAEARDQLELLQEYWCVRVTQHPSSVARLRVLTSLSAEMLARRTLRVSGESVPDALLNARADLVQDGVINEISSQLKAGGAPSIIYSHHILFDYSVAALILAGDGDESQLLFKLQEDPNLVLVARPSIDLHLADLWHNDDDHSKFAAVVAEISRHGDSLAGIAAARVLVSEAVAITDAQWLVDLAGTDPPVFSNVLGWLAGVLGVNDDALRARAVERIEVWASVLARGIAAVTESFDRPLTNQVARLLVQLDKLQTMEPDAPAAEVWASCVAELMRAALEEPVEREPLGGEVSRFLPRAIAIDISHGQVLRLALRPEITTLWPPRYLYYLVDEAGLIAGADPELARDLLLFVLRSENDSEQTIPLHQGIVSLNTTPKNDLAMVKHAVGQVMPAFIRVAGVALAVDVVAAALPSQPDATGYPIACRSAHGQVDFYGPHLPYGAGHGVAETIVSALTESLQDLDTDLGSLASLVDNLVERIRHPEAWHALLSAATQRPTDLGHAFLPALASGGLNAHSGTRFAAGNLIRTVGSTLSTTQQQEVEHAILAAPDLLPDPSGDAAEQLIDELSGCLIVDRILDASLAERAHHMANSGGPPTITPPQAPVGMSVPLTLKDYLGDQDSALTDPGQRDALDALRQVIEMLPAKPSANEIAAVEGALRQALAVGIGGSDHRAPGAEMVFRAIKHRVYATAPQPGSEIAALIMPLLLDAARQNNLPDEDGSQP